MSFGGLPHWEDGPEVVTPRPIGWLDIVVNGLFVLVFVAVVAWLVLHGGGSVDVAWEVGR